MFKDLFKDLNWRAAFRRSAIVIAVYLVIFYVMSVAFPRTFGGGEGQMVGLLINAVFLFFFFAVMYAFLERSRNRRMAEIRKQAEARKKARPQKPGREEGAEPGASALRGRPNPNTSRSRKKVRRRR